jgi:hypothetical protein
MKGVVAIQLERLKQLLADRKITRWSSARSPQPPLPPDVSGVELTVVKVCHRRRV